MPRLATGLILLPLFLFPRLTFADVPPGFALSWGTSGTGPGQFYEPIGAGCDASGNVYIADRQNHRIQKFTNDGVYVAQWGSHGKGAGQLGLPTSVIANPSGIVYVTEQENDRVSMFTDSGQLRGTWGTSGTGPGQFDFPAAIAMSSSGDVYVTDLGNHRIQMFTREGEFLKAWGSFGSGDGEFYNPTGIAVDVSDRVYVMDSANDRVQVFDAGGNFIMAWGSGGNGPGQFDYGIGLAVDASRNIYVADPEAIRILKFSSAGDFLTSWGSRGVGGGYFNHPSAISVDGAGNVFVVDSGDNRIQKFDPLIPPPGPRPDYSARILLHLTQPLSKDACLNGRLSDCRDASVSGALSGSSGPWYYAYVLVARGSISSVAGLQLGISYDHNQAGDMSDGKGVDIFSWNFCADRQFPTPAGFPPGAPNWPEPGSGNLITWYLDTNCQFGETAVAGYFYLAAYSPDVLRITARPVDGKAAVADCIPRVYDMEAGDLGFATFSDGARIPGCNPCITDCVSPTPIRETTWGAIKSLFH